MQDDMNHELTKYVEDHISPQPEYLSRIERQTNLRLLNGRMCSGLLQGRLLKMIVEMIRPERVLELGTFSGFSALCIAEALKGEATLDTIEIDDELEDFIRRNLSSSECGERVTLHIGAAEDVVKKWNPATFDLIFIDADKRRYSQDFDLCLPLLRKGGFIIADNTLWDGHIIEPKYDKDKQTLALRAFNDKVVQDERLDKVILPLRDGLTIIRKK